MTRQEAKGLQEAFNHFANNGNLWHALSPDKWCIQDELNIRTTSPTENIIEDHHFEARKAFALGEEIEWLTNPNRGSMYLPEWLSTSSPDWDDDTEYRPKPKLVYEWQFTSTLGAYDYVMTDKHYTDSSEIKGSASWTKFEPSKRLRK